MAKKKIGIYICSGCRIGDSVDTTSLCSKMQDELSPGFCKTHRALCSQEGSDMIQGDLIAENPDAVLFVACGKGTKDEVFVMPDTIPVERANIRDWVAWAMEPFEEDTIMAAEDYLRMGFAGLNQTKPSVPFIPEPLANEILVIGGGVAGLNAAITGAVSGYNVHLVENSKTLGGWSEQWKHQVPFNKPFKNLEIPQSGELIKRVKDNERIRIYLETDIERIEGQPGQFLVYLSDKTKFDISVGSIVIATGWKPYKPESGTFYGLNEIDNVITSIDLEKELKEEKLSGAESFLFIQCAGSRDEKHLPYCSSVCCGVSLKQTRQIRENFPDAIVYIVYKDIRTTGFQEDFYKEVQDDPQVIFIKGDILSVEQEGKKVKVSIDDQLLGEEVKVTTEKVILATGMVPNSTSVLKLAYRQGEGLPELQYNFSDSHFICFPYETRRTGIYAAGGVRAPLDIPSAMEDGAGAMMKAIQVIEAVKRGESVHPRSGDRSFPELFMDRCTDCKRCTEECPFGTYDETVSGTPIVNPSRCRRCGICLGACPERVISFSDFSININSEKIRAVEIPDEFEEKPRVLMFMCENDAVPALELAVKNGLKINPFVRIIPVRCLGSVNRVWVSDALSQGYDGILQIGCKPGDDYQCHFIHGSELAEQRSEIYEETLSTMMLEQERIMTRFVEISDYKQVIEHIDEYMEEVELMGPNPFKDM